MKFVVTGHTSPIGKLLVAKLLGMGHAVQEIGRYSGTQWCLGEKIPDSAQGDILVHLAHDRTRSTEQAKNDCKIILQSFTGFTIFLSSTSAHSRSKSIYGQSKYFTEQMFVESGGAVIKSGLICGPVENNLLTKIFKILSKFRFIVLPYSGNSRIFVSHSSDLLEEIIHISMARISGVTRGFSLVPTSLYQITKQVPINRQVFIIKMPGTALSSLLIKLLKILFPKNDGVDSLMSLVHEIEIQDIILMHSPKTNFRI